MEFRVVIPARYNSSRLPGKVLALIGGKTMLQHVYDNAVHSGADSVMIATDDKKVKEAAEAFGAVVVETGQHNNGSERVAEAVNALGLEPHEIVVNVQADQPLFTPDMIQKVAYHLEEFPNVKVNSVCCPITDKEAVFNPNQVKVVLNKRKQALYFSRAPIPWDPTQFQDQASAEIKSVYLQHFGIYGFRASCLMDYSTWEPSPLEEIESLEQLRFLHHGSRIQMLVLEQAPGPEVNTPQDLKDIQKLFN